MGTPYSAGDVLGMAIRLEEKGARFYRRAAKLHPGARDILVQIAAQEDQHVKTFEGMRKALAPNEKQPPLSDPYGDAALYLHAMVDNLAVPINQDPEKVLTGKESLGDLFKMAIGMEKDSITFYLGLRDLVPASMGGDKLQAIVKEEMSHIAWLSDKRAQLG